MRCYNEPQNLRNILKNQISAALKNKIHSKQYKTHIEVGAGDGLYTLRNSNFIENNILYIAIERTRNKFLKLNKRCLELNNPNIFALHTDAIHWIHHHIPKNNIHQLSLLFPNPYPKKKSANKRFHNMPFFSHLSDYCHQDCLIEQRTNSLKYHLESFKRFPKIGWNMKSLDCYQKSKQSLTRFETKYLERNETCYSLLLAQEN